MKKTYKDNILSVIVIIIGIVIISAGIMQDNGYKEFFSEAKPVDATIDDVISRRVRQTKTGKRKRYKTEYDVYVTYTIDDTTYEHIKIDTSGLSATEGDIITLYYLPENPRDVRDKEYLEGLLPNIVIIGLIVIAIGGGNLLVNLLKANSERKLMKSGIRISAEEICIDKNRKVKVKGRHPYIIYCRAYDPRIGEMREFASKNCYEKLKKYNIREVDIYLDPNNPKKHFVDVAGAIEMAKGGLML